MKNLPKVFEEIARVRKQFSPCGILLCGDLTTAGVSEHYAECVEYLTKSLSLTSADVIAPGHWHVVPGNHDVDRKSLKPGDHPFAELFAPLKELWAASCENAVLTVDEARITQLESQGCGIALMSLNSCVGCGEWRGLPKRIREQLLAEIEVTLSEQPKAELFCEIAEQLDAPVFDKSHLDEVSVQIKALGRNCVPVVLAHHNLLPQQTPRLAPYAEVSNAGMLRTRLTSLGRPVIYCHGHIHEELIEVVSNPRDTGGLVASVSAPEAVHGFIRLSIDFNRENVPLGVTIVHYELRANGEVKGTSPVRIRLLPLSEHPPDDVRSIAELSHPFSEPLKIVSDRFNQNGCFGKHRASTIRDILLEAEWHGLVELDDRDASEPKCVRVRRVAK